MAVLHLGVLELPYASKDGTTTGQVATILEAKYGIMETFYNRYADQISTEITDLYESKMEALLSGAPLTQISGEVFIDEIAKMFNYFLDNKEMDGLTGIPTKAALEGRSSRFKGKKSGGERPSFVDTSLFENSFRSWIDGG